MSDRIEKIRVIVVAETEYGNTRERTIETAPYETILAFTKRIEAVIDDLINHSDGLVCPSERR